MKAELQQQWRLLDLQKLDTRLDQIDHRLANLPQAKELAELTKKADTATEEMILAQTAVMDVEREIARSEADVQQVRDRMARNEKRLASGEGSAKDLQALQHETDTLARRQVVLEDAELEIMERAEGLRERLTAFTTVADEAEAKVKQLKAEMGEAAKELETERAEVQRKRDDMAPSFAADLLAEYDGIRARSGVAAAALHGRRCLGCGLELNHSDLQRIRSSAADQVVYCDECGRILVRTAESDL
ncbi:hypothetical protein FA951_00305 [Dermacoccus nishinomiyaensis]|uniref:Uncharacterized protein n=1 Tax=Dermacoccus nishinomiyaensis TaxID=1274 RepID=A0A075JIB8_9MICO|nr:MULTISPECIES: C4-type zinc ribbon domain-containing protein [Dermacoccus]MBO1757516.1 hypothetical protein [Dermacoccus sp. NHGro5]AIF41047.1 hypothetical protein HX89_08930 [Dermacoccus nishinomiyaensis]EFP58785.1 putative zinc ribbon domain protein [Dermacoccus sp. Ellin185]MCG7429605.1 C4-type zinc ribbon domain-containing protein [Dermacoccus nishinomiyaensis]MCT1604801.1 C4-type zinc ribbon domain-containing protein [Dermacoccus nishinomiyaensis]